jgi:hypothetical protein
MICDSIVEPITRRVEKENKSLDDIAKEICPKVTYGKQKIIRIIKDFLGEEYLIQHAETLKYDVGKAQLAKKRKHQSHENIDATTDAVIESDSVTPIASCTLQAVNTEHVKDTRQTKGVQVLEVHDKPAACCQAVLKVRKPDSENITEKESGEMKESEKILDELDDAPVVNVSQELVEALRGLIIKFSLKEVKMALAVAESDI